MQQTKQKCETYNFVPISEFSQSLCSLFKTNLNNVSLQTYFKLKCSLTKLQLIDEKSGIILRYNIGIYKESSRNDQKGTGREIS